MKNVIITVGAALLVAVPATIGLIGNTSFSQSVPVRPPANASLVDDGTQPTIKAPASTEPTADPRTGDDKGGQRVNGTGEPGDDHGGGRGPSADDDRSGRLGPSTPQPADGDGSQSGQSGDNTISQSGPGKPSGKTESGKDDSSGSGSGGRRGSGSESE